MEKMPQEIQGFSQVEYLMVFIAIIFGYIGAEYFVGWGTMMRKRRAIREYWPHIAWTIFAFLLFIQNWYGIWPRAKYINQSIFYFIYSLFPILLFHLISVVLFPSFRDKTTDMKAYFYTNSRLLFFFFALYFILAIVSSFVYEDMGNVMVQNIIRALGVSLSLLAAWFHKNEKLHIAFLFIGFIALTLFVFALPR
ncbi:MAG: hypothetical protein ACK4ND_06605 [Cytophagaceae bacterium]